MARIKKVLNPSIIIALIALFVALGGSVYAVGKGEKINGKRIKPSSIPGNRLKASAVATKQLKAQAVTGGKVKSNSLTDKQIKGSTLTGVSATSLATVYYAVATVPLVKGSSVGTAGFAGCPPGTFVIGGGASVSNEEFAIVNDSGPSVSRVGWGATGFAGIDGVTMTITAICTPVTAIG
jgi:hypothetical protein